MVEDHARFVRGAATLAARVQALRRQVARAVPADAKGRDVQGDPGRPEAATAGPQPARASLDDLLGANLSRAKEALRVLEEYAKLLDPTSADPLVRARYALYALEPDLLARRPSLAAARVYVIVGEAAGRPPVEAQVRACLAGGVRLLQLRLKTSARALLEAARALTPLVEDAGGLLIVNDRPDVSRLAGAHGVHVGQDDLPPGEARRIVGPGALVGASAHDEQELARIAPDVDYVGFGTLFASPTKPELGAQGLERLRRLAATCPAPIYGIGGVTLETAPAVIAAGAHGVAVSSAVLDAPDPTEAARRLMAGVAAAAGA